MNSSILSDNLRKLRLEKRYTQEQAAQLLSVSPQSVSRWECGTTLPEVTLLPEIARLYAVTVDDLFRESCRGYQNYASRLLAVYESTGRMEDFLAARQEFQKLFASGEYDSEDLRGCGVLYQYLMDYAREQAMACFDKVLEREEKDPVYYRTWQQKITLMAQTGQGAEAVAIHRKKLEQDRENPRQWALLAAACLWTGDHGGAYECVREALEKFPREGLLHVYAGDICRNLKKYEEAFSHWEEALRLDKGFYDARYSMGFCYEELGEYEKAYGVWKALAADLAESGLEVEKDFPLTRAEKCRDRL